MHYFTEGIRRLIEKGQSFEAVEELAYHLEKGPRKLFDQALRLKERIRTTPVSASYREVQDQSFNPVSTINAFIAYLEEKEVDTLRFLYHIQTGERLIFNLAWNEARHQFEFALRFHQPGFSVTEEEIREKIRICNESLQFYHLVESADQFFSMNSWENAANLYRKAIHNLKDEFRYDRAHLKERLRLSSKGVHFAHQMNLARGFESQGLWHDARESYFEAIKLHEPAFRPDLETLKLMIDNCRPAGKKPQQKVKTKRSFKVDRATINIVLMAVILILVTFLIYDPSPEPANNIPTRTNIPDELLEEEKPSPSVNVWAGNDNQNMPVTEASYQIAILPFCHDEQTFRLSRLLYKDVIAAFNDSQESATLVVPAKKVAITMMELNIEEDQVCGEANTLMMGEFLRTETLVIGTISAEENQNIRLKCEIFDMPSRQYIREIVLTDSDIFRLRRNLHLELKHFQMQ